MSFLSGVLGRVGGAVKGAATGFIGSGFNPIGALAGGAMGAISAGGGGGGGGSSAGDQLQGAAGAYGGYASDSRNRFLNAMQGGQQSLETSTKAAVQNALPSYMQDLQGSRENAIRRGASNGDLQTSNEGDLASAFQRNVSNSVAGQASNLYNTQVGAYGQMASDDSNKYLALLAGNRDADQNASNNKWNFAGGLLGAAGQVAGAYYGGRR